VIRLNAREEYIAWEQRCDEFIESLDERSRIKRPWLSVLNSRSDRASERFEKFDVDILFMRALDTARDLDRYGFWKSYIDWCSNKL